MSFWKSLGKILGVVVAVAAVVFAGPAIAAVAGAIGATSAVGMAAAGALYGAAAGAVTGGLWTGTGKGMLKGAAIGGLIGGAAGYMGVGTPQGAFGYGASGAPVPTAPGVPMAAAPPLPSTAPVAQADFSLGTGGTGGGAGLKVPTLPIAPTSAQPLAAAVAPQTQAEMLKQAAIEGAKETGKYMMYAEGVKLLAGGIAGAAASKDDAENRAATEKLTANRNYQPVYGGTTRYQGPTSDRPREQFGPDGMLTRVRP